MVDIVKVKSELINNEKVFTCDICNYNTVRLDLYKKHILTNKHKINAGLIIVEIKEKLDKCPKCDYTSNKQSNVKRHIELQHNDKKIKCEYCSKTMIGEDEYNKHRFTNKHFCKVVTLKSRFKGKINKFKKDYAFKNKIMFYGEVTDNEMNDDNINTLLKKIKKINKEIDEIQEHIIFDENEDITLSDDDN